MLCCLRTFNWELHFVEAKPRHTKTSACLQNVLCLHPYISITDAKLAFSSGRDCGSSMMCCSRRNRAQRRWSVSAIMSVVLPKRVKVSSQIDAYWGILFLCLDLYFLWIWWFNIIIYSTGFPAGHSNIKDHQHSLFNQKNEPNLSTTGIVGLRPLVHKNRH